MNVNLGCGNVKLADCINVDYRDTEETDIIHDLTVAPWPFADAQFENAIAKDVIEHILYVVPFLDECWRIIKPGGQLFIRTSYFYAEQAYQDPTHLHYFTLDSFDYFDPDTLSGEKYPYYSKSKWRVKRKAIDGQELVVNLIKR